MRKLIVSCLCVIILLLTGCSGLHPYQPAIQQGNVFSQAMVNQIKPGMSKEQVENILGEPLLSNTFFTNHWAYVYTLQRNGGPIIRKNLDIYFNNARVNAVSSSEGQL